MFITQLRFDGYECNLYGDPYISIPVKSNPQIRNLNTVFGGKPFIPCGLYR